MGRRIHFFRRDGRKAGLAATLRGVRLVGSGGGHLVEDNRIDQSLSVGIRVDGDGNPVQRNRVFDPGIAGEGASGIDAEADIRDNTVDGMIGATTVGVYAGGRGTEVRQNRIRDLAPGIEAAGIRQFGMQQSVVDNLVVNVGDGERTAGAGIAAGSDARGVCRANLVSGYAMATPGCHDTEANVAL